MLLTVAREQHLQARPATLSMQFLDGDGEPAAPLGAVTVRVQRGDGTEILPAGTATVQPGEDVTRRTVALTAAQTATLDLLTATWTEAGGGVFVSYHEIVGGFYFTVADARAADPSLTEQKYSAAAIRAARREVEEEFEAICQVAFVPRYWRARIERPNSAQSLSLPTGRVRTLRSLRTYSTATTFYEFTSGDLAAVSLTPWGTLNIDTAALLGPSIVEFEHGYDVPPREIRAVAIERLRELLTRPKSGIPANAQSFVNEGGATFRLARPGMLTTGNDRIDSKLALFSERPAVTIA